MVVYFSTLNKKDIGHNTQRKYSKSKVWTVSLASAIKSNKASLPLQNPINPKKPQEKIPIVHPCHPLHVHSNFLLSVTGG